MKEIYAIGREKYIIRLFDWTLGQASYQDQGYNLRYDGCNHLCSEVFGTGEGLADNSNYVPNITVAIRSARELTPAEIQYTDSTDYQLGGSLTLRQWSRQQPYAHPV